MAPNLSPPRGSPHFAYSPDPCIIPEGLWTPASAPNIILPLALQSPAHSLTHILAFLFKVIPSKVQCHQTWTGKPPSLHTDTAGPPDSYHKTSSVLLQCHQTPIWTADRSLRTTNPWSLSFHMVALRSNTQLPHHCMNCNGCCKGKVACTIQFGWHELQPSRVGKLLQVCPWVQLG